MDVAIASSIAASLRGRAFREPVTLCWHGGEPLSTGPGRFVSLLECFEDLREAGHVRHNIQTNATLISDAWLEIFDRYEIEVGVSLDGPRRSNAHRTDWQGRPAFDRAIAGIRRLRRSGRRFSILAVISDENVDQPDALYDMAEEFGAVELCVNVVEREGVNSIEPPPLEKVVRFYEVLVARLAAGGRVGVREINRIIGAYALPVESVPTAGRLIFPTIAYNGDVTVLSPELGALPPAERQQFVIGNVLTSDLLEIVAEAHSVPYVQQFFEGVEHCRIECPLFAACGGGEASNKWSEHRSLDGTLTEACQNQFHAPALAVMRHAAG
jgi:uncharacterized protein